MTNRYLEEYHFNGALNHHNFHAPMPPNYEPQTFDEHVFYQQQAFFDMENTATYSTGQHNQHQQQGFFNMEYSIGYFNGQHPSHIPNYGDRGNQYLQEAQEARYNPPSGLYHFQVLDNRHFQENRYNQPLAHPRVAPTPPTAESPPRNIEQKFEKLSSFTRELVTPRIPTGQRTKWPSSVKEFKQCYKEQNELLPTTGMGGHCFHPIVLNAWECDPFGSPFLMKTMLMTEVPNPEDAVQGNSSQNNVAHPVQHHNGQASNYQHHHYDDNLYGCNMNHFY